MAKSSDTLQVLSERQLCEIAGVPRTRRRAWAANGLLRQASNRGRYGELDAAELAALAHLIAELDYGDASMAWSEIRESLRGSMAARRLLAVVDLQGKTGSLVTSPSAVGGLVLGGHRFRVLELTEPVADIRKTYRRVVKRKRRKKPPTNPPANLAS
jgi:hypothetical protein